MHGQSTVPARLHAPRCTEIVTTPQSQPPGGSPTASAPTSGSTTAPTTQRIGPYELVELLGEGGFGTVHRARQSEPVVREVAIKLLKPGMASAQVVQRFDLERQTLARMDHPHIARIFDAGVTADGQPWFAMELVHGEPLTTWCERHGLDIPARLLLLRKVCAAVQHAHIKGVIHRDLKPSNVLVHEVDGEPVPTIIDFGIAKALAAEPGSSALTLEHQMLGTPDYMAPEQAAGELDIDTRADVYSLGVLLYELLTGTPPFDTKKLLQQGYRELLRHVCEVTPPKPSTRISELVGDSRRTTLHQQSPLQHTRALRGDLDWIAMRALEKDRDRRYPSAGALADDLDRFLRGDAVSAGPPGTWYRLRKFAGRHRVAVGAGMLAITALVTVLIALGWAFVSVRRERDRADAEAQKARAVNRYLSDLLDSASPALAGGHEIAVRDLILEGIARLDTIADQPAVQAVLRNTLGGILIELGEFDRAQPICAAAAAWYRSHPDEDPLERVRAMHHLAWLADAARQDHVAAETHAREALALLAGVDNPEYEANLQNALALAIDQQGRTREARQLFEAAADRATAKLGAEHPYVTQLLTNLGNSHLRSGDLATAEPIYLKVVDVEQARPDAERNMNFGTLLHLLALCALQRGDLPEAERLERRSLAIRTAVLGDQHWHVCLSLMTLGDILVQTDRASDAVPLLRRAVAIAEHTWDEHPERWAAERRLAEALGATGQSDEALRLLAAQEQALAGKDLEVVQAVVARVRGGVLFARGEVEQAEQALRASVALFDEHAPPGFSERVAALRLLATVLQARGETDEATRLREQADAAGR